MNRITIAVAIGFLLTAALPAVPAQNARSFVSGHGSDAAACTLAVPRRTLAHAIAVTNAGGEIDVLDIAPARSGKPEGLSMNRATIAAAIGFPLTAALPAVPAHAQNTRSFVSCHGNDVSNYDDAVTGFGSVAATTSICRSGRMKKDRPIPTPASPIETTNGML
jgi:hypothetical protein